MSLSLAHLLTSPLLTLLLMQIQGFVFMSLHVFPSSPSSSCLVFAMRKTYVSTKHRYYFLSFVLLKLGVIVVNSNLFQTQLLADVTQVGTQDALHRFSFHPFLKTDGGEQWVNEEKKRTTQVNTQQRS